MNKTEQVTKSRLEFLGLIVEPVDSDQEGQSADFFAADSDGSSYLVEVKSRETDEDFSKQLVETGNAYREAIDGRTNVASRKVKKADKQLRATQSAKLKDKVQTFCIVVFASLEENEDFDVEQFRSTLYGIVKLIVPNESGEAKSVPCFYFTYSDFYRFKTIDGAILLTSRWIQFCPNPFGNQMEDFEKCLLYKKFTELDAIFIPEEAEMYGAVFIADGDIDRSNKEEVTQYVKRKYNLKMNPVIVEPKLIEQAILVNKEEFEGK